MKKFLFAMMALMAIATAPAHADGFLQGAFADGYGVITKIEEYNMADDPNFGVRKGDATGTAVTQGVGMGGGGVGAQAAGYVIGFAVQGVKNLVSDKTAEKKEKRYVPGLMVTVLNDEGKEITHRTTESHIKRFNLKVGDRVSYTLSGVAKTKPVGVITCLHSDKPLPDAKTVAGKKAKKEAANKSAASENPADNAEPVKTSQAQPNQTSSGTSVSKEVFSRPEDDNDQ
ncbi:MAG: hypothetical protein C4516_05650 [Oxalobacter sp.]|nr:MAG: hypothetical protein C4516_05650 [Oxalobacter sp.]